MVLLPLPCQAGDAFEFTSNNIDINSLFYMQSVCCLRSIILPALSHLVSKNISHLKPHFLGSKAFRNWVWPRANSLQVAIAESSSDFTQCHIQTWTQVPPDAKADMQTHSCACTHTHLPCCLGGEDFKFPSCLAHHHGFTMESFFFRHV